MMKKLEDMMKKLGFEEKKRFNLLKRHLYQYKKAQDMLVVADHLLQTPIDRQNKF